MSAAFVGNAVDVPACRLRRLDWWLRHARSIGRKVSTFNAQSVLPAAPKPVWNADRFHHRLLVDVVSTRRPILRLVANHLFDSVCFLVVDGPGQPVTLTDGAGGFLPGVPLRCLGIAQTINAPAHAVFGAYRLSGKSGTPAL